MKLGRSRAPRPVPTWHGLTSSYNMNAIRIGSYCITATTSVGAVRVCAPSLVCWALGVGVGGHHKTTLASRIAGQCVIVTIISCRLVLNRICRFTIR